MDYFQSIVAEWLCSDSRTLIAQEYYLRLSNYENVSSPDQRYRWPDFIAVRMIDRKIFLCEITWSKSFSELALRITEYFDEADAIRESLGYWLGVPQDWEMLVWMFVPRDHIPKLLAKSKPNWRIRFTALESIQPWKYVHGCREVDDKVEAEVP